MHGNNQNPVSLIDTMAKLLIELNFTDEVKEVGYEEGSFHEKPDFEVANDIMRLYNESLYSVAIPEHLRSHREDIEDIFADNFAETVEKKMGGYGVKEANIKEMLNKVKEIESDLQNSFLLEGYLVDVIKKEKGYDDQMMEDLFGYRVDPSSPVLSSIMENSGQSVADSLNVLKDTSAWMESKFEPYITQESGGPGKGLYQFEKGPKMGGETAIGRYKNYYNEVLKQPIPEEMKRYINQENPDFTDFPAWVQTELFYADKQQDPKFILSELGSGELPMKDAYIKHHYRGDETDRISKQYDREMEGFQRKVEIDNLLDMYYTPQRVKMQKAINDTLRGNR